MISGQAMQTSVGADLVYDLELNVVLADEIGIEWTVFRDGVQVAVLSKGEGIQVPDPTLRTAVLVWPSINRQEVGVLAGVYTYRLRAMIDELKVDEASGTLYVAG